MTMAGGQNGDSIGAHGNGIYSGSGVVVAKGAMKTAVLLRA